MKALSLALILLAAPASAEDKPNLDPTAPAAPGAVALYLSATALYDQGVAAKDPLMVLTAARMMRGLDFTPTIRKPDSQAGGENGKLIPIRTVISNTLPDKMFDEARSLDAAGNFSDLIEIMSRETPPTPKSLRVSSSQLAPVGADKWTLQFYGDTYAELAILGARTGNLDLSVTDADGNPVCIDNGASDTAYCGFVPLENGDFTVTVTNSGPTPDGYTLLTN